MMNIILFVLLPIVGVIAGWLLRWLFSKLQLSSNEQKAERIKSEAIKEAETVKTKMLLEAKESLLKDRNQAEKEIRERRGEIQRMERRLLQKEEALDEKTASVDKRQKELADKEGHLNEREKQILGQEEIMIQKLEEISVMSREEAKKQLIDALQDEAKREAHDLLAKIEQEVQATADQKARECLIASIQRIAVEVTSDVTISTVSLPNDEMKGRIIGREGRNIRTLETLTGVDVVIDDTPEAVVISCFDPIRKEVAKIALERLIQDGRIHPARIEEIVQKVVKEVGRKIIEEGEKVLFDLALPGLPQEGIKALGRLYYRTSYGQNILQHSKEVAILAGMIASELGVDPGKAKRAGLLHDIGKGIESDGFSNHAELGADLAKRIGEDKLIVNAILAHHGDVEPESIYAIIVQIADSVSAARPGARRESIDDYLKRLENLEKISTSFPGVEKAFAIQAGRELRVLVDTDKIDDIKAKDLAKSIAQRIENELKYPGRIKVTIIREMRVVEYAR